MNNDLVRPSRDGDQFHYHWAARRCLRLLPLDADLVSIAIEGPSADEGAGLTEGLNSIDVAEYEGSADVSTASAVRYLQLKHSTRKADEEWTLSGLADTLANFGARYRALVTRFGEEDVAKRFAFEFITNRPFAASLIAPLNLLRAGTTGRQTAALERATGLSGSELCGFARLLTLTGRAPDFLEQRNLLRDDTGGYLPDSDADAPLQLKELVTRRATTEFEHRPDITRLDVLKALGADERDLYPAPPLIDLPQHVVEREQLQKIAGTVVAHQGPTIVRADGGEGKSVLAMRLGTRLPAESETFVYDCFGNGAYRSASGYRHRCRDGLVQLANDMAGRSLCDPLIPTPKADAASYVRAFLSRVQAAAQVIAARSSKAILCLLIDAADNAETAARELHDGPSFARLLLLESWPANVRLLLTARPHRVDQLRPSASTLQIDLRPFSLGETAENLRGHFPTATDADVAEFHRLTSQNPRVQAAALGDGGSLPNVLRRLGGVPLTVDNLIGKLLDEAVQRVRTEAPEVEQVQIDRVCAALATLRPFVPLDVVARTADVPVALVRSLIHDLQRPLLVRDDAVQFRDEPTETWFRERFRPTREALGAFIDRLLPLTSSSAYVAAGLPQLMLEAGQFDALVALALSGRALPADGTMSRRDVELQRLQFALKAALRDGRYEQAAKLALKAGGETAADARQQKMLSSNTDLGARFLEPEQMLEQVSRRLIAAGAWTGSDHAYEAAFLSGAPALQGDARSRLRIAYDWLAHWADSARTEAGTREKVEPSDVAELALAEMNLHGAEACARGLRRWRRREVSFAAGRILASRLVDGGRFDQLDALAHAAENDLGLLLALVVELALVGRVPPKETVRRATRLVTSRHLTVRPAPGWDGETERLEAVTHLVAAAAKLRLVPRPLLARTLTRYLPPEPPPTLGGHSASFKNRRHIHLHAYALRAALRNRVVALEELVPPRYRAKRGRRRDEPTYAAEAYRLREDLAALLPWHVVAAEFQLGRVRDDDLGARIAAARTAPKGADRSYREKHETDDEIAWLWASMILPAADPGDLLWRTFDDWRKGLGRPLYATTQVHIARRAAHSNGRARQGLNLARGAFDLIASDRSDAEGKADFDVLVARAVLPISEREAKAYFEEAIQVSSRIGEENLPRWEALLHLAETAGRGGRDQPELAYRLSRIAELTHVYIVRDKYFDWQHTVGAMVALSPVSGPAILSRWIDRRFAVEDRSLPELVDSLHAAGELDGRDAAALLPFKAWWARPRVLEWALDAAASADERAGVADHFLRYARLSRLSASDWRRIEALFANHSLDPKEPADRARAADRREKRVKRPGRQQRLPRLRSGSRDWNAIFKAAVPTDAAGITIAHDRFRAGSPPFYRAEFYREALARVNPGEEAAFLDALRDSRHTGLYDLRELLEILPDDWKQRVAVRKAMAELLKALCRRECGSIFVGQESYPALPWRLAEDFSGVGQPELVREAVTAIGATTIPADFSDLFRIASLLSQLVTEAEASDVLAYGLDLLETSLTPDEGDGSWSPAIAPPSTMPAALAGYIWAALGSPWAARRWEAAHVVRALFRLGREDVIDAVIALANAGGGNPFASPKLRFYVQHALEWLVIAMARAAAESGPTVARRSAFLEGLAKRQNPHVAIRMHAADALLSLRAQGLALRVDEAQLRAINRSSLPTRKRPARDEGGSGDGRPYGEKDFLFGDDFGRYWIAPLARRFAVSRAALETQMESLIRDEWRLDENGHYDRDARAKQGFFRDDEIGRLYSSYPSSDNLSFYLSYHALMTVAGRLLDTMPLVAPRPDEEDSFASWLAGHRLTREDGLWLSDRRDPTPDDLPPAAWPADWPAEPDGAYFGRLLEPSKGWMAASGYWSSYRGAERETVRINTILASSDRSRALALALQTAMDQNDYRLPTYEEDGDEIDLPGWQLKAWTRPDEGEAGFDRLDPWASGMAVRALGLGMSAADRLQLRPDAGERGWCDVRGGVQVRSEVWSDGEDRDGEWHPESGQRLVAKRAALDRLMRATGLDMILELRVRRDIAPSRYDHYRGKDKKHDVALTQIVLLRPGEAPWATPGGNRPRRGSRRRTRPRKLQ